jgi:WD40 repeat protein
MEEIPDVVERSHLKPVAQARSRTLLDGLTEEPTCLALGKDGLQLALGSSTGCIDLWDVRTGKVSHSFSPPSGSAVLRDLRKTTPTKVIFGPDGQFLYALFLDDSVAGWEIAAGKLTFWNDDIGSAHCFRADGCAFAGGSRRKPIKVWNLRAPAQPPRELELAQSEVLRLSLSPDGRWLAAACSDGEIRIWDLASSRIRQSCKGHDEEIKCLAFDNGGKRLASCGVERLFVWDVGTGGEVLAIKVPPKRIEVLTFTPNGEDLVGIYRDRSRLTAK